MFVNLKNSKTHEFIFLQVSKSSKKHEIKFLQVDTHRAFDFGSVYFISECQGRIKMFWCVFELSQILKVNCDSYFEGNMI